jgi:hypothetical protein
MSLGKPTWSAAFMGTGTNSSVKPCVRGMNFELDRTENNTAFLYTDDKPMKLIIPSVSVELCLLVTANSTKNAFLMPPQARIEVEVE